MTRRASALLTCAAAAALTAAHAGAESERAWAADGAGSSVAAGPVADDAPPADRAQAIEPLVTGEPWRFAFMPYVWLFAVDGSIKENRIKLDVATNLHDSIDLIQEHLDITFAGHLEAFKGDWSFFVDGCYVGFSDETTASHSLRRGIGSVTAENDWNMHIGVVEFGAAKKVAEIPIGKRKAPLDLIGGARWNHLDYDVAIKRTSAFAAGVFDRDFAPNTSTDWVDPFVGLRGDLPISERMMMQLRGDVGGGFGNGSDFAWNVVAGVTFRLNPCVDLFAGYRWYEFERDISGRKTDLQLHGPGVGVTIRF